MAIIWFLSIPVVVLVQLLAPPCLATPPTRIPVTNLTTDQSALLSLKSHVTPSAVLDHNWSAATSCCSWIGVKCGVRHRRVVALNLSYMGLAGTIPPHLGNLSFLSSLNLRNNNFHGILPHELGFLRRLKRLRLEFNSFSGELPLWFGNLTDLQVLYLHKNQFYGQISLGIFKCTQIQYLSLSINKLTGTIPREIGNLTVIKRIHLGYNNLTGIIPLEIGKLITLEILDMPFNSLTGPIPSNIFNISAIKAVSLQFNHLSGQLPSTIGLGFPNLEQLYLGGNKFEGVIPNSIYNASRLTTLDLILNSFTGIISNAIGNLKLLESFNVHGNFLTGELGFLTYLTNCKYLTTIDFSDNPLGGVLPISVGNLSTSLEKFHAYDCKIGGSIPKEIGNMRNLIRLSLCNNNFIGSIPITIGRLKNLQELYVYNNRLQGSIPYEVCHLKRLGALNLNGNWISGSIPTCVDNLTSLRYLNLGSNKLLSIIPSTLWSLKEILELNLSTNLLTGYLPVDVGNLKVVTIIDLSRNEFSGDVPSSIGGLLNLVQLNLSQNRLHGTIPQSFGDLVSLEFMDISYNILSGVIPKTLEALSHLKDLNLSSNKLEGEIPNGGPFTNFSAPSFMMNHALCGAARLQVPPCKTHRSRKIVLPPLKYILPIIASTILLVAIILVLLRRQKKNVIYPSQAEGLSQMLWRRISYHQLVKATHGFCESNLLSMGSFSSIYRGILSDGENIAVKVFNLQLEGALKSFEIECEMFRNIRHRNIIKIITICANIDFKCLILQYMPNGSLEKWLYSFNLYLDIHGRLNIMIDVASALEYLHRGYSTLVVHSDLKPNNVLLDGDMVAKLGGFGVSKFLGEEESMEHSKTIATSDYIAPEYGFEGIVSSRGDVYSFGILVMETFTRKRPTDEMFIGEMSLKRWVKESVPHALTKVVDPNLLRVAEEYYDNKKECVSSILKLALCCSLDVPGERMDIKDVLGTLKKIRTNFQTSITRT